MILLFSGCLRGLVVSQEDNEYSFIQLPVATEVTQMHCYQTNALSVLIT